MRRPSLSLSSQNFDLLNPDSKNEATKHKLKRLVQAPNSYFMDVKCPGCFQMYVLIYSLGNSGRVYCWISAFECAMVCDRIGRVCVSIALRCVLIRIMLPMTLTNDYPAAKLIPCDECTNAYYSEANIIKMFLLCLFVFVAAV